MRRDKIRIEEYDTSWPALFEAQRRVVAEVLGSGLVRPVEHIGSTSVPGLSAKPIIDMLAVVANDYGQLPATLALASRTTLLIPAAIWSMVIFEDSKATVSPSGVPVAILKLRECTAVVSP